LGPRFGTFRLVTMGRSFHWMDRADTLRRLDDMIEPDGAVALFDTDHVDVPENAWRKKWRDLVDSYCADDPLRNRWQSPDWVPHRAILLESPFRQLDGVFVIERHRTTIETLVDRALSMSGTSRALIGDSADALAADIRALMVGLAPQGSVTEVVRATALIARRPAIGDDEKGASAQIAPR
jgi:hypothetical protein